MIWNHYEHLLARARRQEIRENARRARLAQVQTPSGVERQVLSALKRASCRLRLRSAQQCSLPSRL
jgi:hypothetical protein